MTPVSEIKLIRTDTTLDLSQKAEKVCKRRRVTGGCLKICEFASRRSDSLHRQQTMAKTGRPASSLATCAYLPGAVVGAAPLSV